VDGFELDGQELEAVARRLDAAADLPAPGPLLRPVGHDRLDAALRRFGAAWTRGHQVLTADASAAGAGLRSVVTSATLTDQLAAERLGRLA
jgi:hypothetical protein